VGVFTVSELNSYIKKLLDSDGELRKLTVRGELSNYTMHQAGHHYFTMKDNEGSLKCVMFRRNASNLQFKPENGMKVQASGSISLYPRDGAYQLYVDELVPDGIGDLHIAFEQLKEKLSSEGLFEQWHKKPIPQFPQRIALVTSPTGAAVQDMLKILKSRWSLTKVIILPVRVQGAEAPLEIALAIEYANKHELAELVITGRGGGSIEDLWAFNDETVARAIFASKIPVISAVGHEPDITISDYVADLRAATPSNAAELAVPDINDVRNGLRNAQIRVSQAINGEIKSYRQTIDAFKDARVMRNPRHYIDDRRLQIAQVQDRSVLLFQRNIHTMKSQMAAVNGKRITLNPQKFIDDKGKKVDTLREKLQASMQQSLIDRKVKFAMLAASLDAMSPLKVLGRGYAIAKKDDGSIIRNANDVVAGEKIAIRLEVDEISCMVIESEEK